MSCSHLCPVRASTSTLQELLSQKSLGTAEADRVEKCVSAFGQMLTVGVVITASGLIWHCPTTIR